MQFTRAIFLLGTLSTPLYANNPLTGVASDLNNFFNNVGYASNTTAPQAFESQAAGFFGGGSLYARNQVRNLQLIQLDLPSYRAGCGGIDLFTGSISFLSHQKLVDLGKQIMTNAGAYAVDVLLSSTVPELKQVRDYLQNLEQMANHASISSCETAQNFIGGIWPKTAASQQKICKDQATMGKDGLMSDYVKARMDCAGIGFDGVMDKAAKDPERKKQVVLNKNLVWSILQSKTFLSSNTELAEMVISLTGTIIIDKEGKVTNVPSLASNADLIAALIGGGQQRKTAKIWKCTDLGSTSSCLKVSLTEMSIDEKYSLSAQVKKMILSLNNALLNDSNPTPEQQSFASLVSLPVLKFLAVLNSSQYGNAAVDMEDYATLIAHDLLQHYLSELLEEIAQATTGSELNESLVKEIGKRIEKAQHKIAELDPKVGRKLKEKLDLIERIAIVEKQVASTMGNGLF